MLRRSLVVPRRGLASKAPVAVEPRRVRNLGVMAHIDAGKTTLTERLLFAAGATPTLGDVDKGDTVTDHMEQERERGITITSAAISLSWEGHQLNLIDTPGHVDFTLEVERCLRVMDGAVGVLDGSAGVEAQTLTVWRQARRFALPALFFLNKMDTPGADRLACLRSIRDKLHIQPLCLSTELRDPDGRILGVRDLLRMEELEWPATKDQDGRRYKKTKVAEAHPSFEAMRRGREELLGELADADEAFGARVLDVDGLHQLSLDEDIFPALRRATLSRRAAPVLVGSALRNRGVQPVLDAVLRYLPSPLDAPRPEAAKAYKDSLCALAFKISHDKRKGPLTFFRVYSGVLKAGQHLYNVRAETEERNARVFRAHSDRLDDLHQALPGDIAVVTGLSSSITGDTFTDSHGSLEAAVHRAGEGGSVELAGIQAPDPVYFCSVEAPSSSSQLKLDAALAQLAREDPSLRVKFDEQSQQNVLQAMGELHIEIVRDRLRREWGLDVFLGPLQINYREKVEGSAEAAVAKTDRIGDSTQRVSLAVAVFPVPGQGKLRRLKFRRTEKGEKELEDLREDWKKAILRGARAALDYGPLLGYPGSLRPASPLTPSTKMRTLAVEDVGVELTECVGTRKTTAAFIRSAALEAVSEAMLRAGTSLIEPMMKVELRVGSWAEEGLLRELAGRRAEVEGVSLADVAQGGDCLIKASAPLAELSGFASAVRSVSSGEASLHMEVAGYRPVSDALQQRLIDQAKGKIPI